MINKIPKTKDIELNSPFIQIKELLDAYSLGEKEKYGHALKDAVFDSVIECFFNEEEREKFWDLYKLNH